MILQLHPLMSSYLCNFVLIPVHDVTPLQCKDGFVLVVLYSVYSPGVANSGPGASFIKLSVDFILKVYVGTKARICRNLRKNPFINPS